MSKERIQLNDSVIDIVMKMSEGAVRVLADMIKEGARIGPDDFFGGLGAILGLPWRRIITAGGTTEAP